MKNPSSSLKDRGRIYLDHNATTKPLQTVVDKLPEWLEFWGNPSSIHQNGRGPKNLLRESRSVVAQHLRCHPLEIIFTSGGTEGNNLVIKGFFEKLVLSKSFRNEFITTEVEHPSVNESFNYLRSRGAIVHKLKVALGGIIDLDEYRKLLHERTAMVSIMFANNETGSLFPIGEMCKMAHAVGAQFHTDAVQTLGKYSIDMPAWGVDFATFSGHKVYALKGVGVVFAKRGQRLASQISGGGHERGRRAGTENILAISSLGEVLGQTSDIPQRVEKMRDLRDQMENLITARISGVRFIGADVPRIANTSSLVFENIDGESLLMNLDLEGISVSTGAACSSGNPEPSPVLIAMGLTRHEAQGSLRVSLGWETTRAEIEHFVDVLAQVVNRLRILRLEVGP